MSIFERFGVKSVINAFGPLTSYGGSYVSDAAQKAMHEAAQESVRMDQLQAGASKIIAKITHAEAGIVTSGGASAQLLGTAAILAGLDIGKMDRLPDTSGMPNEIIKPWHHITGYDHSIRAAGAKLIGIGLAKAFRDASEQHIITSYEVEEKITENTVAIGYTISEGNCPPLDEVTKVAHKYDLPVIVDASPEVPPIENLHRFIDMGADLVCFSGGKGLGGPQASGILCGRKDLISSAVLQLLDFGGPYETWDPPQSLIPKEKLRGVPSRGIGRGMKVSKEAIVGLLVALEELTEENFKERIKRQNNILHEIITRLEGVSGVEMTIDDKNGKMDPKLIIKIDDKIIGKSAMQICHILRNNEKPIILGTAYVHRGIITVSPNHLKKDQAIFLAEAISAEIKK